MFTHDVCVNSFRHGAMFKAIVVVAIVVVAGKRYVIPWCCYFVFRCRCEGVRLVRVGESDNMRAGNAWRISLTGALVNGDIVLFRVYGASMAKDVAGTVRIPESLIAYAHH